MGKSCGVKNDNKKCSTFSGEPPPKQTIEIIHHSLVLISTKCGANLKMNIFYLSDGAAIMGQSCLPWKNGNSCVICSAVKCGIGG